MDSAHVTGLAKKCDELCTHLYKSDIPGPNLSCLATSLSRAASSNFKHPGYEVYRLGVLNIDLDLHCAA
jgi:hypothetical protein